jgi:hypothetical protein
MSPAKTSCVFSPKSSARSRLVSAPIDSGVTTRWTATARSSALERTPESSASDGKISLERASPKPWAACARRTAGSSLGVTELGRRLSAIVSSSGIVSGSGTGLARPSSWRLSAPSTTAIRPRASNGLVMASIAPVCCTN